MPTKKPNKRRRVAHDDQPTAPVARACFPLTSLPIEILAEILLCTCSPPTVLAVSRTCSFLYRTLALNPTASFIWRGVRQTCAPYALPDPGDCWKKSEADYAAFVFGGGVCEICRQRTRTMYTSFSVRIRLCGRWHCRRELLRGGHLVKVIPSMLPGRLRENIWVPHVEIANILLNTTQFGSTTWQESTSLLLRKTDWDRFNHDFSKFNQITGPLSAEEEGRTPFFQRCETARQRLPAIMDLSLQLILWRNSYDSEYKHIKRHNRTWTKDLARREGWDFNDLVASQTYGSLQLRKDYLVEELRPADVAHIRPTIESELLTMRARHGRQDAEATYKEKLAELKKIYERLRCGTLELPQMGASRLGGAVVLPPLSIFLTLPSVRALKGSPNPSLVSHTDSADEIKSSSLAMSLIMSDVHAWAAPVRKRLMEELGFPNGWQSANMRALHPLERVTARFFCRKCGEGRVGRGSQREGCLDLKGVCAHVCKPTREKRTEGPRQEAPQEKEVEAADSRDGEERERKRDKGKRKTGADASNWNVELFEKDEKTIRLIKAILELTGLSEEDPSAATQLNTKGGVIRCMSCTGWIAMDFETAIGHAHRHDDMQIQLLPASAPPMPAIVFTKSPTREETHVISNERLAFERGTVAWLLRPTRRTRRLCNLVNYGCQHCFRVGGTGIIIAQEKKGVGTNGKRMRAMNFHGLRSHLKEKHGIHDIRDEDLFCYSPIRDDGSKARPDDIATACVDF